MPSVAPTEWLIEKARTSAPTNTGEFAARVQALKQRLDGLTVRLVDMQAQQNDLLERLAIEQLEQQKGRLATYSVQARFELAAIYDGIASQAPARSEGGAASEAPDESSGGSESQGPVGSSDETAQPQTLPGGRS